MPEYSKDTQHCNQFDLIETTYKPKAAQPCSYIYPIYSVVKNRLRQRLLLLRATGARLRQAQGSVPADSVSRKLNLELVYFDDPQRDGGAERDRTVDPLLAKQVLSQLSYSPDAHQYNNVRESGGPG